MMSGQKRPLSAAEDDDDEVLEVPSTKRARLEAAPVLPPLAHGHFCVPVHFPLRGLRGDDTGVLRVPQGMLHPTVPPPGVWFTTSAVPGHRLSVDAASASSAEVRSFDRELAKPFWTGSKPSSSAASTSTSTADSSIKGSDVDFNRWAPTIVDRYCSMTPADWGPGLHLYAMEGWSALPPITKKSQAPTAAAAGSSSASTSSADGLSSSVASRQVRVLSLDVDGTLIRPRQQSATFCEGAEDWQWCYNSSSEAMITRLADYHARGYCLVLFSNQMGASASQGRSDMSTIRKRFEAIGRRFNEELTRINNKRKAEGKTGDQLCPSYVPLLMMFGSEDDLYRKPRPGMFFALQALCCGGVSIDCAASLYVGDQCGRVSFDTASASKADSSSSSDKRASDLQFALNLGLPFATPEAFFLGVRGPGAAAAASSSSSSTSASSSKPAVPASAPKGGASMMASFFGSVKAGAAAAAASNSTAALRDWDPLSLPLLKGSKEDAKDQAKKAGRPAPSGSMLKVEHGFLPSLHMHQGPRLAAGDSDDAVVEEAASSTVVPHASLSREQACNPTLQRLDGIDRPIDVGPPSSSASPTPEIVLLVGCPATGKSSLAASCFPNHRRINQDSLGSKDTCMRLAKQTLAPAGGKGHGMSVVIDATNLSPAVRRGWQQLAHHLEVPIRAVVVFANDRNVDALGPYSVIGKAGAGSAASASTSASAIASAPSSSSSSYSQFIPWQDKDPGMDRRLLKGLMFHLNEVRRLSPLGTVDGGAFDRRAVPGMVLHNFAKDILAPTPAEIKGTVGTTQGSSSSSDDHDLPCAPFAEVIPVRFVPVYSYGLKRVAGSSSDWGMDPQAQALLFARNLLFSFVADSSSRGYAPPVGGGAGDGGKASSRK